MQDIKERFDRVWKIAIVIAIAILLVYLLNLVVSDSRWIFTENTSLIILIALFAAAVIYLFRRRSMKQK